MTARERAATGRAGGSAVSTSSGRHVIGQPVPHRRLQCRRMTASIGRYRRPGHGRRDLYVRLRQLGLVRGVVAMAWSSPYGSPPRRTPRDGLVPARRVGPAGIVAPARSSPPAVRRSPVDADPRQVWGLSSRHLRATTHFDDRQRSGRSLPCSPGTASQSTESSGTSGRTTPSAGATGTAVRRSRRDLSGSC